MLEKQIFDYLANCFLCFLPDGHCRKKIMFCLNFVNSNLSKF